MTAIKTEALTKKYNELIAVDHLDLQIRQGELFSLLGVNGAGKSTTIKMLSCLTKPTGCEAYVGGATPDVYSIADGMPQGMNTVYKGLPEPFAKRTVEGDIGMRYSLQGIIDAAGLHRVSQLSGLSQARVTELAEHLKTHTDLVPNGDAELEALDRALASLAVEEAVTRHAGTIEETYTLMGLTYVQSGKNLTNVKQIVVTGGSLIHTSRTAEIASHALYSPLHPASLRPKAADVWVDRTYILAAMGLLSTHYPQTALRIMKKELEYHGHSE